MKKVDFLFIYEVKNRELENITLLAAELEKRGFTTAFLNTWYCQENPIPDYDAEVCVVSACYTTGAYEFFTRHAFRFKKVVNLQWEQILRNGYVEAAGQTSWDFSGEALRTRHICWGENTKRRLMRCFSVPEEFLKVCGYICLDFYRDEFKGFIKKKDDLFKEFQLDTSKITNLFISSFAIATMPKENRGECAGDFNEVFIQNTVESQAAVVDWFTKACEEYPDMQFIYRSHPSEPVNPMLDKLSNDVANFFYISKYPVKHWIYNCDKIYNWTSTSAAEVYASGKQSFILTPTPIDHRITYPFFEGGTSITTYENFKNSLDLSLDIPNQPLDSSVFSQCYQQSETPVYKNICDVLEETYKSTEYQSISVSKYTPEGYRKYENRYNKFWYSRLNIVLCKFAKKTSFNIPFLNIRRKLDIPDKEKYLQKINYRKERIAINYATPDEIEELIRRFREIIG